MSNRMQKGRAEEIGWARKFLHHYGVITLGFIVGGILIASLIIKPAQQVKVDCEEGNLSPSEYGVQLTPQSSRLFNLEFAKTPTQQELGLSRRPCIPADGAVLFLFPKDDKYGIWMKEMLFPIDVLWINKDKKIVKIEKNMQPSSYPKIYYPDEDVRYVIEFRSGTADAIHIAQGSQLSW